MSTTNSLNVAISNLKRYLSKPQISNASLDSKAPTNKDFPVKDLKLEGYKYLAELEQNSEYSTLVSSVKELLNHVKEIHKKVDSGELVNVDLLQTTFTKIGTNLHASAVKNKSDPAAASNGFSGTVTADNSPLVIFMMMSLEVQELNSRLAQVATEESQIYKQLSDNVGALMTTLQNINGMYQDVLSEANTEQAKNHPNDPMASSIDWSNGSFTNYLEAINKGSPGKYQYQKNADGTWYWVVNRSDLPEDILAMLNPKIQSPDLSKAVVDPDSLEKIVASITANIANVLHVDLQSNIKSNKGASQRSDLLPTLIKFFSGQISSIEAQESQITASLNQYQNNINTASDLFKLVEQLLANK